MIPKTRRGWIFTGITVAAGLAIGVALGGIAVGIIERGPPMTVLASSDAVEIAAHDNRVFVHWQFDRHRMCPLDTTRWLVTTVEYQGVPTKVFVQLEQSGPVPVTDMGWSNVILSYPLPQGLWPGEWYFLTRSIDHCGWAAFFWPSVRQTTPIPIDIERARATLDQPVTKRTGSTTTVISPSPLAK